MNLCNNDHDEVCYEGRNCPACSLNHEIGRLEAKVDELSNENTDLERDVEEKDARIASLEEDLATAQAN